MIDPDLYPGVAVDLTRRELRDGVQYVRFWRMAPPNPRTAEAMAWCIAWYRRKRPRPVLLWLPLNALRISQNPTEPPPLPDWACLSPGEREWQREWRMLLEQVICSVRGREWSTL